MSRGERTLGKRRWGQNLNMRKQFRVGLPTKWFSPSTATGVECCSLEGRRKTVIREC